MLPSLSLQNADVPPPEACAVLAVLQFLSSMALRVLGTEDKKILQSSMHGMDVPLLDQPGARPSTMIIFS
jgi:hypothetical protein